MAWGVYAQSSGRLNGALAGNYVGASGSIGVGVGVGANVLFGGSGNTTSLQPLSLQGTVSLNKLIPLVVCASLSGTAYAQNDVMSNVLQKMLSRIEKLKSSCSEDLKQYCSAVTPGGGRLVYCLEAYEDQISAKCAFDLGEVELDLQATTEGLKEALRVCQGDIQKLCGSTQPGEGRIAACLAANRSSVSADCVDAVGKLNIK